MNHTPLPDDRLIDAVPKGDPSETFRSDLRGYKTKVGVLIGQDRSAHWVQSALKGYKRTGQEDVPREVDVVGVRETCSFRKPRAKEIVANVHVGRGLMKTPVHVFSREELEKRSERWVELYKRKGENAPSQVNSGSDVLKAIDVVVTEKSKPVYLVLQNEWSNTLWNVHTAPGVVIAHVAVLGSGAVGVANLKPNVPVEFMNDRALQKCDVTPVREPADHWLFVRRVKNGSSGDLKRELAENTRLHHTYSKWFDENFGMPSETAVIGIEEASHVLVGPLPETPEKRVAFRPLKGARVRIAHEDYVFASGRADYRSAHDQLVREVVTEQAGGDLTSIDKGS